MRRDLTLAAATLLVMIGSLGALTRVFTDTSWAPSTAAALLLSLGIAAASRRVVFGGIASAVFSLVGFIVFTYVVHLPPGPLIPGAEQFDQAATLFREGLVQFRDQPAPTAPLQGLVLIITTATWGVTHLTHELLVRWRLPGLSLIPPAVMWIVPLAVPLPLGRTWPQALPFLAGAALVLLLESDSDVSGHVSDGNSTRLSGPGLAVGATALAIAAALPGILPGYGQDPWVDLAAGNEPRGLQPIVDVGDRLKLPEDRPVMRVQADRRTYLRVAALDTFDDNTWRLGPPGVDTFRPTPEQLTRTSAPSLPLEVPIAESTEVTVDVEVIDLANIYVPVPYQPIKVTGRNREDMVYSEVGGFIATGSVDQIDVAGQSRSVVTSGFEYGVRAALPTPSYDQLRAVELDPATVSRHTQLDQPYERLAEQARQVYDAAGATTAVDKAFALQDWFTGDDSEFDYSTDVSVLRGSGALERFVFETKNGYCEYFATSMAVMLRATGIPARVAVGFLPGEVTLPRDPAVGRTFDTYTVSTSDAHAWVEVLFPGYGWIKFEPTPRSDGATMQPEQADMDPLLTEFEQRLAESGDLGSEPEPTDPSQVPDDSDLPGGITNDPVDESTGAGASTEESGSPLRILAVALVALTAVGVGVTRYRDRRHHPELHGADRVLAAQRHLHNVARRHGVGRRPSETAAETSRRWVDEGRTEAEISARFAEIVQAAAFGGTVDDQDGLEAERLGDEMAEGLKRSVGRRERLLAPVRIPVEQASETSRDLLERLRSRV